MFSDNAIALLKLDASKYANKNVSVLYFQGPIADRQYPKNYTIGGEIARCRTLATSLCRRSHYCTTHAVVTLQLSSPRKSTPGTQHTPLARCSAPLH